MMYKSLIKRSKIWIALASVLLLSSCSATDTVSWDPVFTSRFTPTQQIMSQLNSSIQNIDQTSAIDGTTVTIKQTLGDEYTIYIAIEVHFPDDFLLQDNIALEEAQNITPKVQVLEGIIEQEDIADLNLDNRGGSVAGRYHKLTGYTLTETSEVNFENNVISYIICFNRWEKSFKNEAITLLIGGFTLPNEGSELIISDGIHATHWTPENTANKLEFDIITEEGDLIGTGIISPFILGLELFSSDFDSYSALRDAVMVTDTDGNRIITGPGSGSFDSMTGAGEFSIVSQKLVDLTAIGAVHIGDIVINFS